MNIKLSLLALFIAFQAPTSLFAQTTPEEIATRFFQTYKNRGSDSALDYLFSVSKFAKDNQDGIDELKTKVRKSALSSGAFWGYDLLATRRAAGNLVLLTFLVRHEKQPFTFRMLFYKPNDKWQLQNFKFDNKMDEELEEASKGYRFEN